MACFAAEVNWHSFRLCDKKLYQQKVLENLLNDIRMFLYLLEKEPVDDEMAHAKQTLLIDALCFCIAFQDVVLIISSWRVSIISAILFQLHQTCLQLVFHC